MIEQFGFKVGKGVFVIGCKNETRGKDKKDR